MGRRLSACQSGCRLPGLDQLDPGLRRTLQECDQRAARHIYRTLLQLGAEAYEPGNLGIDVLDIDAKVLQSVVRVRVSRSERLSAPLTGDVDGEAGRVGTADEPVPNVRTVSLTIVKLKALTNQSAVSFGSADLM